MQAKVAQKEEDLLCSKHNQQIIAIKMDNSTPFSDIMLCSQCISEKQTISSKIIGIAQVKAMISKKYKIQDPQQELNKQLSLKKLDEFQKNILQMRTQVISSFNEVLNIVQPWYTDLSNIGLVSLQLNWIQEIQKLHESNENLEASENQIERLDLIQQNLLQNLKLYLQLPPIRYQLVNSILQVELSSAMSFNITRSILVAGCFSDVKIWKFDNGQLTKVQRLKGHSKPVKCLVFSKKMNYFISGSDDQTIRCWKQLNDNNWVSSESQQKHSESVLCLIMNNDEEMVISGSLDKKIKVWKINQLNQLKFDYTLEKRHTGTIYAICLNESESSLVSCSQDKKIILWVRGKNQRWIYQNQITTDDIGYRICFTNNYQIAWQQCHNGFTHILEIENYKLKFKQEIKIELNQNTDDNCLFPTIFNKKKQVLIQKHYHYVYIIRKQRKGGFKVELIIDCESWTNYGQATEDGEYFVNWNEETSELRVYRIIYD